MSRDQRNRPRRRSPDTFRCRNCRLDVSMDAPGTKHRNHCPSCLWSRHVDNVPGDRAADCAGSMEPIAVCVRADGEELRVKYGRLDQPIPALLSRS